MIAEAELVEVQAGRYPRAEALEICRSAKQVRMT
jgi:hypothetical protein